MWMHVFMQYALARPNWTEVKFDSMKKLTKIKSDKIGFVSETLSQEKPSLSSRRAIYKYQENILCDKLKNGSGHKNSTMPFVLFEQSSGSVENDCFSKTPKISLRISKLFKISKPCQKHCSRYDQVEGSDYCSCRSANQGADTLCARVP